MEYNLKQMGHRISTRRNELKIPQHKLAEIVNISNTHLSNIERGKKPPGFIVFLDICSALQVDSSYITDAKVYADLDEELIVKIKKCSDEDKIKISSIIDVFLNNTYLQ